MSSWSAVTEQDDRAGRQSETRNRPPAGSNSEEHDHGYDCRRDGSRDRRSARSIGKRKGVVRRIRRRTETPCFADESLGDATQLLGLWIGRFDALVQDEIGHQVAQHRAATACVAVELPTRVSVSHWISSMPSSAAAASSAPAFGASCRSSFPMRDPCSRESL